MTDEVLVLILSLVRGACESLLAGNDNLEAFGSVSLMAADLCAQPALCSTCLVLNLPCAQPALGFETSTAATERVKARGAGGAAQQMCLASTSV
jgi:hypothetical protein